MTKKTSALIGAASGLLNGLFGSGGGVIAVPMLEKSGEEPKKAHAESLAVILPLSVASAAVYLLRNGDILNAEDMWIIPAGLAGAALGSLFMKKIPVGILKKIFGVLLIISGARILFL
ncbi:MAG: sulfite exporter TauE/SafE family protein [Oscillospiraceae bacterium]